MSKNHFVYVISAVDADGDFVAPVKVGISKDWGKRLKTLQTASHLELALVFAFATPNREIARGLEASFHEVLREHRAHGEWFNMHPMDAVRNMCGNLFAMLECIGLDDDDRVACLEQSGAYRAMEMASAWGGAATQ